MLSPASRSIWTNYFAEAADGRREKALEELHPYFEGTHTFTALQTALNYSEDLMDTEYYSMRLVQEAKEVPEDIWPAAVRTVELSAADTQLTAENKLSGAAYRLRQCVPNCSQ